ncbi:hypothetical protein WJX72_011461 [[Myrmecia] bisecta]|uniref:Uncharacterized protein n=1 Tax=[Myrmecia] bisecta TaxID=41462 RepID=A0AAW1QGI6_9CHLO
MLHLFLAEAQVRLARSQMMQPQYSYARSGQHSMDTNEWPPSNGDAGLQRKASKALPGIARLRESEAAEQQMITNPMFAAHAAQDDERVVPAQIQHILDQSRQRRAAMMAP